MNMYRLVLSMVCLCLVGVHGRPRSDDPAVECPDDSTGESVYIPHPTDCSLYYHCVNSEPVLMSCHPPLYFDPSINVCNWPDLVDCKAEATTSTTTEEPSVETTTPGDEEETTTMLAEEEEGSGVDEVTCPPSLDGFPVFLPHPHDCNLYYECEGEVPVLMACPQPLYFDPSLNVCNWPELVHCSAQEATTEEPEDTTILLQAEEEETSGVTCPPSEDGLPVFVPHPTDCSLYYECDGSSPILMSCPEPLHFDPRLNVCNWPEFAKCEVSTTSTTTPRTTTTTEGQEETTQPEEVTTLQSDMQKIIMV